MKQRFLCALKMRLIAMLHFMLSKLLPNHIKRLLFITSIHLKLANELIIKDATLARLNAKMNIASDISAIKVAEALTKRVQLVRPDATATAYIRAHRDVLMIDGICPADYVTSRTASLLISSSTPWLNYGGDKMAQDIKRMLNPCRAEVGRQALSM